MKAFATESLGITWNGPEFNPGDEVPAEHPAFERWAMLGWLRDEDGNPIEVKPQKPPFPPANPPRDVEIDPQTGQPVLPQTLTPTPTNNEGLDEAGNPANPDTKEPSKRGRK